MYECTVTVHSLLLSACAAAAARTAAKAMRGYALARATSYGLLLNSAHTPHVHVRTPKGALRVGPCICKIGPPYRRRLGHSPLDPDGNGTGQILTSIPG